MVHYCVLKVSEMSGNLYKLVNWLCLCAHAQAMTEMLKQLNYILTILNGYTGCTKKMHHSDLYPIPVLEVGFYFFTCVLNSEF